MGSDAAAAWKERASDLLSVMPASSGSVLDWGAGLGHLVAALKALGVDAEGVESSQSARQAAERVNAVRLLESAPADRRFDVVTLYHSLEHVEDPRAVLIALRECLTTGGMLFVEVPHVRSVDMLLPRWRHQILSLPHHLVHFTPGSLLRLLEASSYEVLKVVLINPRLIEVPLSWRARLAAAQAGQGQGAPHVVGTTGPALQSSALRRAWRDYVLPRLREGLPGWRFQVLAKPL